MTIEEKRALAKRCLFYITLGIDIILLVAGFILPPMGHIDPTVIQGAGILFGFGAIAWVPTILESAKSVKLQKGDSTIEVTARDSVKKTKKGRKS